MDDAREDPFAENPDASLAVSLDEEPKSGRYRCRCGYSSDVSWQQKRCPVELGGCGFFYDIVDGRRGHSTRRRTLASTLDMKVPERISTGVAEFDKVLGGGFYRSSVVIVTGDPGAGKSTLLLQVADGIASQKSRSVIYFSCEENEEALLLLGKRLGLKSTRVLLRAQSDVNEMTAECEAEGGRPTAIVVDSVQLASVDGPTAAIGSATMVDRVGKWLKTFAIDEKIAVFLISHVTKDGDLGGPKSFEHIGDAVIHVALYPTWDETSGENKTPNVRELLTPGTKNRLCPPGVTALLEMGETGLQPLSLPTRRILSKIQVAER